MFIFKNLSNFPELIHGFSERADGDMKNSHDCLENQEKFCQQLKINRQDLVFADLKFSDKVTIVSFSDRGKKRAKTDGLVTAASGIYLAETFADCLPIFLYCPKEKIVGLVHVSWHNTLLNIADKTIEELYSLGAKPREVFVGLGPSIGPYRFRVSWEIWDKFHQYPGAQIVINKNYYINLWQVNKKQLEEAGVLPRNIEISKECTYSQSAKYFSYRRDSYGEKKFPTMMGVIGRKS